MFETSTSDSHRKIRTIFKSMYNQQLIIISIDTNFLDIKKKACHVNQEIESSLLIMLKLWQNK